MNFDCGIYAIIGPNGRRYIGQARSFKARWISHTSALRSDRHVCKPLQHAWNKYGEKSFRFVKIAIVPESQLNSCEQDLINEFVKSGNRGHLYNIALYVRAPLRGILGASHPISRPVICITNGMKFVSGIAAVEWLRTSGFPLADNSTISAACSGKLRTAYGFKWRRVGEEAKADRPRPTGQISGSAHHAARAVQCIQNGMIFATISEAVIWLRDRGHTRASHQAISKICSGREKSIYGFQWKYVGDPDPGPNLGYATGSRNKKSRSVICIETGCHFQLMSDAVQWLRSIGRHKAVLSSVSQACSGKLKSAYGYHWAYSA